VICHEGTACSCSLIAEFLGDRLHRTLTRYGLALSVNPCCIIRVTYFIAVLDAACSERLTRFFRAAGFCSCFAGASFGGAPPASGNKISR
jgi:hypothetical protein